VSLSPPDSSIAVAQQYATANSAVLYLPLFGDITSGFNYYAGTKKPQKPKISVKPSK
jgi:hypothetical protein